MDQVIDGVLGKQDKLNFRESQREKNDGLSQITRRVKAVKRGR